MPLTLVLTNVKTVMANLRSLSDFLWGAPLICLLLGTGVYLTILLRGMAQRKVIWAASLALGRGERISPSNKDGISAFSSLATELAATIGIGNLIGVVSAMTLGGPGALFWMEVSAFLGLSTKLVESTLSVKYRICREGNPPLGGPMVTLTRAFPHSTIGKILGCFYAFCAILSAFGMGNLIQASAITEAMQSTFGVRAIHTGTILGLITLFSLIGGMHIIPKLASFLVPGMGAFYLSGCLCILFRHMDHLVLAVQEIFVAAFRPCAVAEGLFGTVTVSFLTCLRYGIARGVFSNEAGLGAGGIAAAATSEKDHLKQGWISSSGVFYDTILICTITGLTFACSQAAEKASVGTLFLTSGKAVDPMNATDLLVATFESSFGRFGGMFLTVCIALFALATILGWAVQGEAAFVWLFGEKRVGFYRICYAICPILGAAFSMDVIWLVSDLANGLLVFPNLICLWVLAPGICKEILGSVIGPSRSRSLSKES